jgi:aminomethyltransferase
MLKTPLYEKLAASGARMGEYCGAETALAFGPHHDRVQSSFNVLRDSCGVYDLGWRAKIALTGADRVRWLNGVVTNNIRDLELNHGNYNFILSPQGRIQGDCYAYNRGEYLLVGTEMSQAPRVKEIFDKYIIMDDVEVTDISEKLMAIGIQGPNAREVLERAGFSGLDVGAMQLGDITWNNIGLTITRMASDDFVTYELWFAPENAAVVWDAVVAAGAIPVGSDALELFRIAAGVPKFGQDIRERDLPQETNQSHALHFAKGCYIGQEIVERIRSRGQVHRQFMGFDVKGAVAMVSHTRQESSITVHNGAPESTIRLDVDLVGAKLTHEGKEVGEITSAALVDERILALGYVRREHAAPCSKLQVGETAAIVTQVPFAEAKHIKPQLVVNS